MMDPIHTKNVYPPIPMRQFDWCAYRDPEGKVGWGRTADEAIANLKELEDDGRVPERETAWLVERKVQPPQYITSDTDMPALSSDPWRAARFPTERAAFDARLRLHILRDECVVVEHVFINKTIGGPNG